MNEDIKRLLKRNIELTQENNKLLKRMRRNAFIAGIFKVIWLAIILGLPVALYYYVFLPYIEQLGVAYQGVQNGVTGAQDAFLDIPFIGDIIGKFLHAEEVVKPTIQ